MEDDVSRLPDRPHLSMGDLGGVPGSCLQLGPAPALEAIEGNEPANG